jgi:NAD dependent epimerase/dehydratase family enzyme
MGRVLPLARLGLAGPLGSGRQFWPWITLVDEVRALMHLIDRPDLVGPVNLVGPTPSRQRDLMQALGTALHRPAVLPAPAPALRLALGEFASDILGSQRVVGRVLVDSGFAHTHAQLGSAVSWLVGHQD